MLFTLIALLTGVDSLSPNAAEEPPLNHARQRAGEIRTKLKRAVSEIETISKAESEVLIQLNDTERALNQTRKRMLKTQNELMEITANIKTLHTAKDNLEKGISKREVHISKRLTALYKLGWLGQLPVLATADSGVDLVRRKQSIALILEHDHTELDRLHKEKKTLDDVLAELNARYSAKDVIEKQLQQENEKLSLQLAEKNKLLVQIQTRKKLQLAAFGELKEAADKLNQAISGLAAKPSGSVDDFQHLEADFSKLKGLLNLPVKGKIIYFYGRYKNKAFNVDNFRSGITIRAEQGEPIRSAGKGIAIYSDWFKGYGNMIILDHGRHYYTVYAHLEEIFKFKGDRVEADEVIATVGDTGSLDGAVLHFEVRHYGKPLDPMQWIRKRVKGVN